MGTLSKADRIAALEIRAGLASANSTRQVKALDAIADRLAVLEDATLPVSAGRLENVEDRVTAMETASAPGTQVQAAARLLSAREVKAAHDERDEAIEKLRYAAGEVERLLKESAEAVIELAEAQEARQAFARDAAESVCMLRKALANAHSELITLRTSIRSALDPTA